MGYFAASAAAGVEILAGSVFRAGPFVCPNPQAGASISKMGNHFIVFFMVDAAVAAWITW
jgi:hypothetical protein